MDFEWQPKQNGSGSKPKTNLRGRKERCRSQYEADSVSWYQQPLDRPNQVVIAFHLTRGQQHMLYLDRRIDGDRQLTSDDLVHKMDVSVACYFIDGEDCCRHEVTRSVGVLATRGIADQYEVYAPTRAKTKQ